jgi:hypothetical protein
MTDDALIPGVRRFVALGRQFIADCPGRTVWCQGHAMGPIRVRPQDFCAFARPGNQSDECFMAPRLASMIRFRQHPPKLLKRSVSILPVRADAVLEKAK